MSYIHSYRPNIGYYIAILGSVYTYNRCIGRYTMVYLQVYSDMDRYNGYLIQVSLQYVSYTGCCMVCIYHISLYIMCYVGVWYTYHIHAYACSMYVCTYAYVYAYVCMYLLQVSYTGSSMYTHMRIQVCTGIRCVSVYLLMVWYSRCMLYLYIPYSGVVCIGMLCTYLPTTYVRMYVCRYVRVQLCTYVRMRMYAYTYVRMYVCTYVRMRVYVYTYACTRTHVRVCAKCGAAVWRCSTPYGYAKYYWMVYSIPRYTVQVYRISLLVVYVYPYWRCTHIIGVSYIPIGGIRISLLEVYCIWSTGHMHRYVWYTHTIHSPYI